MKSFDHIILKRIYELFLTQQFTFFFMFFFFIKRNYNNNKKKHQYTIKVVS